MSRRFHAGVRITLRMICRSFVFALLFVGTVTSAGVIDRRIVAPPTSRVIDSTVGSVVANGDGTMFLAYGQRFTSAGERLDEVAIVPPSHSAVAWKGGWLTIDRQQDRVHVNHLANSGELRSYAEFPTRGVILGAASLGGERLAVIELSEPRYPQRPTLWLTTTDEGRAVQQRVLGEFSGAAIGAVDDGFLLATHLNYGEFESRVDVWRIDTNGTSVTTEALGVYGDWPQDIRLGKNGDRAAIVLIGEDDLTVWTVGADLRGSAPYTVPAPIEKSVIAGPVIAVGEQFFVMHRFTPSHSAAGRVLIIDRFGNAVADLATDPIDAAERIGENYFVVRPWGAAGIATGDPRAATSPALQLRHRLAEQHWLPETVASGDVTLVRWFTTGVGWRFARIGAAGETLEEPQIAEMNEKTRIVAIPGGFAFLNREGKSVTMRRLAQRGGWLDPEPGTIATFDTESRGFGAHADADGLMVVWASTAELIVSRFTLDGRAIDSRRMARPHSAFDFELQISVASRAGERLITAQQVECRHDCGYPDFSVEVAALDRDSQPIAPVRAYLSNAGVGRGLPLPDGTWLLPDWAGRGVMVLSRDGSLLRQFRLPFGVWDSVETSHGWRALAFDPEMMVEFTGAETVTRITGLPPMLSGHLGGSGRIVFAEGRGETIWSGRSEAEPGDVSMHVVELSSRRGERRFRAAVRNDGDSVVTNVTLSVWRDGRPTVYGRIETFLPKEERVFSVVAPNESALIVALSDDLIDTDPSDNSVKFERVEPQPAPSRKRGTRR